MSESIKWSSVACTALLLVLLAGSVSAIGVQYQPLGGPQLFEPNKVIERVMIVNSYTYDANMIVSGALEEYFVIEQLEKTPLTITFKITLTLPETLPPGLYNTFVRAEDVLNPDAGMVGGKTAIRINTPILVLEEDKLIKASLSTPSVNEGETTVFSVHVQSFTTQYLNKVYAQIDAFDEKGDFLSRITTNSLGLESYEKRSLVAPFDSSSLKQGRYTTKATVFYDGKELDLESVFRVGTLDIIIQDIPTEMERTNINPFSIQVESGWNLPLNGIWAEIEIEGHTAKTPTIDLPPWETGNLKGFIELGDMPDESEIEVKVYYVDETGTEKVFTERGPIRFTDPKEGPRVVIKEAPSEINYMKIGVIIGGILLVLLLIMNAFWMYRSMKKKE